MHTLLLMCGIALILVKQKYELLKKHEHECYMDNLMRRGPDHQGKWNCEFGNDWFGSFFGNVLWTQGQQLQEQPNVMKNGDILLWNGDVYENDLGTKNNNLSDTQLVSEWLEKNNGNLLQLVTHIKGPYGLIYWNVSANTLWFGRDPLGRKSLLWRCDNQSVDITSVGHRSFAQLTELPACGLYAIKLSENEIDRKTGLDSLEELRALCPDRMWNFVQINVSREELNAERRNRISDLIYPLNTILDDSLGCALWFASRGIGLANGSHYQTNARILLLGMGADELFGGYTKHRAIYKREGWPGLATQLAADVQNIPHRNLGRDDRVVSDHGCQPRMPFLDEDLVNYLVKLPPWHRCWPLSPVGLGDKLLLRLVAYELGLKKCAFLPKRAMQFGSRIANSKEKGSNVSDRLSLP